MINGPTSPLLMSSINKKAIENNKIKQNSDEKQKVSSQITTPPNLKRDAYKKQYSPNKTKNDLKSSIIQTVLGLGFVALLMFLTNKPSRKEISPKEVTTMFEDISGAMKIEDMALPDGLKKLLQKVKTNVDKPELFSKRGGRTIKSILLYGPPGTGKTTFAKALANMFEGSKFVSLDVTGLGSEYVSVTERNLNIAVDKICSEAQANPKTKFFVFVDEIDSVMLEDESHSAKRTQSVLNEFKKCFTEKLGKHQNIITIGATNVGIDVDKARTITGKKLDKPMLDRFEQKILVDLPTKDQIKQSFVSHYKGCELVDNSLKDDNNSILDNICEFLSEKKRSTSFRTLESLYDDAASQITDDTSNVTFENIINAIENKKTELKISDMEMAKLREIINPKS